MQTFTLYPSDFGFLYQECKACFYNKYKHNLWRPKFNMPSIFTKIDGQMTSFYDGKSPKIINPELPEGIITLGGTDVKSRPVRFEEYDIELIIKGKIDSIILFEDNTIGIIDFKTTQIDERKARLYFHQLSGYSVCLEHNDELVNHKFKVSKLGLAVFEPDLYSQDDSRAKFEGNFSWLEIPQDKPKFKLFLREIAELLSRDSVESDPRCGYCKYMDQAIKLP